MNILKKISGSIIIIGSLERKYLSKDITETFYLNNNDFESDGIEDNSVFVAKNMYFKDLHKHFKKGIDNIYAEFKEIKNHYPAFIRESLKITKKDVYILFEHKKDLEFMQEKFNRFNLNIEKFEFDNKLLIKVNITKTSSLKRNFYYIKDNIEKWYNYISDNI